MKDSSQDPKAFAEWMLHELPFFREELDRCDVIRRTQEELFRVSTEQESFIIPVRSDGTLPCTAGGELCCIQGDRGVALEHSTLLGRDGKGRFYWSCPDDGTYSECQYVSLRMLPSSFTPSEAAIACEAVAYELWHASAVYCTACGAHTQRIQGGTMRRCVSCGTEHFPRTDPAVIMLVTDGERCVLGQRQGAPGARWSPLAGFVEPGESAETAVRREVREESGLEVNEIRYVTSQPWPFPRSLMLGFQVHVHGENVREVVQSDEHQALRWIDRETLVAQVRSGAIELPPAVSVASHLIRRWMAEASPT